MSKGIKAIDDMLEYVHQLKKHTKTRRAIHIRMSALESEFRQEHYRMFLASSLRPLITSFGAILFALPNKDAVLITKDAKVDQIDTQLNLIRKKVKDSSVIASLDPVQGVSDTFTEWFDLETDYPAFVRYILELADTCVVEEPASPPPLVSAEPSLNTLHVPEDHPPQITMKKSVRMIPIDAPEKKLAPHKYDVDLLSTLVRTLSSVDVGGLMRKQNVCAVVAGGKPQAVIVHKFVPDKIAFQALFEASVEEGNAWLSGYFSEFLAEKLLASQPNMEAAGSIAASLRITATSVTTKAFIEFNKAHEDSNKRRIIMEFGVLDALQNFDAFLAAHALLSEEGYKVCVADIDLRALLWMDETNFRADFIKLALPNVPSDEWLTDDMLLALQRRAQKIGLGRLVLTGCSAQSHIALGQKVGVTLFQGDAVDPEHKI